MTLSPGPILNYAAPPGWRQTRFGAWVLCTTTLLAGTSWWLYSLRGWLILDNDPTLIGGWVSLGVVIISVAVLLRTTPTDAIRVPRQFGHLMILGGSALSQLLAIWFLVPVLSEDVIRYRLDGRMWLNGISPYASTPTEFFERFPRSDIIDHFVTYPDVHTLYPPTAQGVFVAAQAVEQSVWPLFWFGPIHGKWRPIAYSLPRTRQLLVQRIITAVIATVVVAVLLSVLTKANRSLWYAVLVGWNPLFVIETGGMGHVDIVGVLFVLLTIRALQSARPMLASAMLVLAAGVKPPALLLAPFLLRDGKSVAPQSRPFLIALAMIVFVAILFVPPLAYQGGYKGWLRTSRIYATSWEANGSIYDLIKATADPTDGVAVQRAKDRARTLAAGALAAVLILAWMLRADLPHAGYWIYLIALLTAPVVYPWYLLWVLCFIPLLRGWQGITGLVWCATVGISYLLWRTSDWVLPAKWLLLEYVPVYLALIVEMGLMLSRRFRSPHPNPLPQAGEGVSYLAS